MGVSLFNSINVRINWLCIWLKFVRCCFCAWRIPYEYVRLYDTQAHALWGGTGSDVTDVTLHKQVKKIRNSPYAWGIALYRDGCGYCELYSNSIINRTSFMCMCMYVCIALVRAETAMAFWSWTCVFLLTAVRLKPEWTGAAQKMRKMVGVAAVDVVWNAEWRAMCDWVC